MAEGGRARAWKLRDLREQPVVNDALGQQPVIVLYDKESGTAVIHGRRVDGRSLDFAWNEGTLTDEQSGSEWDLLTGEAMAGPFAGKTLPQIHSILSFEHAWKSFYPEAEYWKPRPSP